MSDHEDNEDEFVATNDNANTDSRSVGNTSSTNSNEYSVSTYLYSEIENSILEEISCKLKTSRQEKKINTMFTVTKFSFNKNAIILQFASFVLYGNRVVFA